MSSNDYTFKRNFRSKLSRTDRKRASLLLQPCWIRTNELQASVCRIVRVIVFPSLLVLWLDIKSSQILARGTGHSHQAVWQIEISSAQGSMGIPRLIDTGLLHTIDEYYAPKWCTWIKVCIGWPHSPWDVVTLSQTVLGSKHRNVHAPVGVQVA